MDKKASSPARLLPGLCCKPGCHPGSRVRLPPGLPTGSPAAPCGSGSLLPARLLPRFLMRIQEPRVAGSHAPAGELYMKLRAWAFRHTHSLSLSEVCGSTPGEDMHNQQKEGIVIMNHGSNYYGACKST